MYPCQKRDKLFSINPDRLLTELEILELIEFGLVCTGGKLERIARLGAR